MWSKGALWRETGSNVDACYSKQAFPSVLVPSPLVLRGSPIFAVELTVVIMFYVFKTSEEKINTYVDGISYN